MTETNLADPTVEDIDDDDDLERRRLEREADRILADGEAISTGAPRPIRAALRDDATVGREWAAARAERARAVIAEEPMRATLYALGIGVVLGLLLRR
jgi:ElaB/YqjD/DUF883 family membrane-anchored ribosome-binding protein